jgi:ribosomal protein S18 acetylase RimI-like enzyme
MKSSEYKINKLQSKKDIPFRLLLLADETMEAIEKYIYDSDVYIVTANEQPEPIAVFALYKISNATIEIKNIAVEEAFRSKGIGSYMINEIKKIAKRENFDSVVAGTPDCSSRQIKFYEQNGFVKSHIKRNFFIENYSESIIENGITLRDMIMLRSNL